MANGSIVDSTTVLVCALQLLVALAARMSLGTWLSPGSFHAGFWTLAGTAAALLASLAFGARVNPIALAVIAAFSVAIWLGDELGRRLYETGKPAGTAREVVALRPSMLRSCIVILCIGSLVVPVRIAQDQGRSILELASIAEWMEFAARLSFARYYEGYTEPLDVRVLLAGLYLAALVGGLILARATQAADRFLAGFPIFVGVVIAAITTSKATFLVPIIMTFSAYLAYPNLTLRSHIGSSVLGASLKLLAAAALVLMLFVGTLVVRYELTDFEQWVLITDRMIGYLVGHVTAFSAWIELEGVLANRELTWGAYTFVGPYSVLAGAERVPGVYETIAFNDYGGESNVFTAFRGLIMDFGFPAALVICLIMSAVAGWHFRRLCVIGWSGTSYVIVSCFYLFTMWSHVVNIFSYNSVLAATAGFIALVMWMSRTRGVLPQSHSVLDCG